MNTFWFAFLLTLFAGLSTGIGSSIAFFIKKANIKFLSVSLGFSAGVMIYVSLVEMLPEAQHIISNNLGGNLSEWITVGAFFFGVLLTAFIDMIIPNIENPHEFEKNQKKLNALKVGRKDSRKLMRIGLFTALALALHNFPEGFATFMSAFHDPNLAISIAFAIAIHNIPEGISVSVPIFYATGDRKKAFYYSFLSGLAEPVGALIGYAILRPFLNDILLGFVFAGIAGIMVYISFDELLPASREYGKHHLSILGLFSGMLVMAISLAMF
ncbi:MAG: zinc transporter ZupT [Alphaproteobacteria bacterium]|jgi:ZIP family zinc transporter|nr:zinc transporter ZupT [Alphaproteobacteria bacterium]